MQADRDSVRLALTAIAVEAAHVLPSSAWQFLKCAEMVSQIVQIIVGVSNLDVYMKSSGCSDDVVAVETTIALRN